MLKSVMGRPGLGAGPRQLPDDGLTLEQISTLEREFQKGKTLHTTDLALLAAEMGVPEHLVQGWYTKRVASWRRDQGLSDCFGQI